MDVLTHHIVARYLQASQDKVALSQRTLARMMEVGGSFGILSAYTTGPKSANKVRHGELVADLQKRGYSRVVPLKGSWEGVTERSILIPNIAPAVLFDLGRKFGQDAVIYKSKDGVVGLYYTKGPLRAEVAVNPQGDPVFEMAKDPSMYTKARGLSFQFGFLWGKNVRWDGAHPIARKQVRQFLVDQLQEPLALNS